MRPKLISVSKAASFSPLIGCIRLAADWSDPLFVWLEPLLLHERAARRGERQMSDPRGDERSGAAWRGLIAATEGQVQGQVVRTATWTASLVGAQERCRSACGPAARSSKLSAGFCFLEVKLFVSKRVKCVAASVPKSDAVAASADERSCCGQQSERGQPSVCGDGLKLAF